MGDAHARGNARTLLAGAGAATLLAILGVMGIVRGERSPPLRLAPSPRAPREFRDAGELLRILALPSPAPAEVNAFLAEGRYACDALLSWLRSAPLPHTALDCAARLPLDPAAVAAAAADPTRPAEARRSAYHLLGKIPGAAARLELGRALLVEQEFIPAFGAIEAAGRTRDPILGPFLRERLMRHPPRQLLGPLCLAVADVGCRDALPLLEAILLDPGVGAAQLLPALDALRRLDAERARELARDLMRERADLPAQLRERIDEAVR